MPSLLTQRKKGTPRKKPPCGRVIEYLPPHSPFQKLIDGARLQKGYSTRELAKLIGTSQSNLYIWTHNKNGFPSPRAFTRNHLAALSRVLSIPEEEIQKSVDASRSIYSPGSAPEPAPEVNPLKILIEILKNEKRERITTSYVLNLAKNLYEGAYGKK